MFTFSAILTIAGLAVRSCHPAAESLIIPMCSGNSVVLETGGASVMHCAGCYVALFGALSMAASAGWGLLRRR